MPGRSVKRSVVVTDGLQTFVPSKILLYFFFGLNPVLKCSAVRFFTLEIKLVRSSFYISSRVLAASSISHFIASSVNFAPRRSGFGERLGTEPELIHDLIFRVG